MKYGVFPLFIFEAEKMWDTIETKEEKIDVPDVPYGHKIITQNFCRAILFGESLLIGCFPRLRLPQNKKRI